MNEFALFLRGINVGGVRVSMPELRETLTGIGCRQVKTWLNTGNVSVLDERTADELRVAAESALTEAFNYEAYVIVRPANELAKIVASWPFGEHQDFHRYVVFGGAIAFDDAQAALMTQGNSLALGQWSSDALGEASEAVEQLGNDLLWSCPKGATTTSPVSKVLNRPQLKPLVTTRNLNTLERMISR